MRLPNHNMLRHLLACSTLLALSMAAPAWAEKMANPIAVFTGLDKISGTTTTFEVNVGQSNKFGGLIVKADVCYTRPATEEPKTTAFVEVYEVQLNDDKKKIFSGWMFAQSPGLNAVEHPVYDVWLINCRDPNAPPPAVETAPVDPNAPATNGTPETKPEDGEPED